MITELYKPFRGHTKYVDVKQTKSLSTTGNLNRIAMTTTALVNNREIL